MKAELILPWPASGLFPNAQRKAHWSSRAELAREQRAWARVKAMQAGLTNAACSPVKVTWTFHKPDERVRDLSGCYGAMKAAEDGIADVIGVDDRYFRPVVLDWGNTTPGGMVIVEIEWDEPK